MAQILLLEGAAPGTPSAGYLSIYASTDGRLYGKDDSGLEFTPPYKNGADIASASTVDLDSATGDWVDITGTTTITGITLAQGKECTVRFTGILTLTHGASLVLPNNGNNITTAAGDCAVFRGDASSIVRCVFYQRANGNSLQGETGLVKLNSGTVSSAATLDIALDTFTSYRNLRLVFSLKPQTDGVGLNSRVSIDGGSTFASSTNYNYSVAYWYDDGGVVSRLGANGGTALTMAGSDIGNASTEGVNGYIDIFNPHDNGTIWTQANGKCLWINSGAPQRTGHSDFGGAYRGTDDVTDWRLLFSSGNIASGSWELYGYV